MNAGSIARRVAWLAVAATTAALAGACETSGGGPSDVPPGVVDLRIALDEPEFGYQITSTPWVVPAGTELTKCSIVKVEPKTDERLVWFNAFESRTSDFTHHMNVHVGLFSVLDAYSGDGAAEHYLGKSVGTHDCEELGDLMEDAVPVYPSQITHQRGKFAEGVAFPGIVPLVLVMEHHYINTTDEDVLVNAAVNFKRIAENDVEHVLTGFYGIGDPIEIPAKSRKIEAWTCKVGRDVNISAISSHSHERGDCFTLNRFDGPTSAVAETPFFVNKDWETPPLVFFDHGEWTLKQGDGVHWACHWDNPENRKVTDGPSADDEMCIFVAVGYPSEFSVEDIRTLVEDPFGVDLDAATGDALVDCEPVYADSPWPNTGEVLPAGTDACEPYEQTKARLDYTEPLPDLPR